MRRWRRVGLVLLAAAALAAAAWVWADTVRGRAFDAAEWCADLDARNGDRLGMARRLLRDGTLVGKSRPEVVEMLGEPQPPGSLGPDHLVYWLAIRGQRSDWLILRLGPDGRVADGRIERQ